MNNNEGDQNTDTVHDDHDLISWLGDPVNPEAGLTIFYPDGRIEHRYGGYKGMEKPRPVLRIIEGGAASRG